MSNTVYDPAGGAGKLTVDPTWDGERYTPRPEAEPIASSLDDLRAAVEQAEQVAEVEFSEHSLYGPGRIIRLVCSTELDQPELKRIQMAGLPPEQRKKRMPDPRKLNEGVVFATLISRQVLRIELLQTDGTTYRPIDGDLSDPHLLAQLGAMDPVMAVRRIFGNKDPYLMRAGEELLNACGYGDRRPGEPGDDEEDPT